MFALNPCFGFVQRMIAYLGIKHAKIESWLLTQYMFGIWYTHMFYGGVHDPTVSTEIVNRNMQLGCNFIEDTNHVVLTIYKYFMWADIIIVGNFYYLGFPPVFFREEAAKELKLSHKAKIPRDGKMLVIEDTIRQDVKSLVECLCSGANKNFTEVDGRWFVNDTMIYAPDIWANNRLKISKQTFHQLFHVKF